MHVSQPGVRVVARVLVRNQHGELLLCKNRRGNAWVPPGGTLDPGETLAQAAVREATEEAGLDVILGPLIYVREFRPPSGHEHVVEVTFRATAAGDRPSPAVQRTRAVQSAGDSNRPWSRWFIQDVDGPRREVGWFTREQLATTADSVYPTRLRDRYWDEVAGQGSAYLGMDQPRPAQP